MRLNRCPDQYRIQPSTVRLAYHHHTITVKTGMGRWCKGWLLISRLMIALSAVVSAISSCSLVVEFCRGRITQDNASPGALRLPGPTSEII